MKRFLVAITLFPLLLSAQSEDSVFIRKIADEVLLNAKAFENLHYLTKQIGGRLAGSPQMSKAEKWGVATMQQAGADTVYMQVCQVPHWVRGGIDKAEIISVDNKKQHRNLDALALGNSIGSGKNGVTPEVVAVSSFDELEQRKNEVKGKIVFYNYPFNPTYVVPAKAYGESGIYRYSGASRAAKYGAVGVLIRSLTEATNNNPHTGAMKYNDSFPKIPAAALGVYDADHLWQTCKDYKTVKISLSTFGHFLPDTTGHNVIGELRGTSSDFITIGGHLDSWDVNEGAHDDGTGIVQTMEVLRVLKTLGYKPKKTIRFVLFANEENGTRGGQKYAEEAKAKNEHHVFALESDEGGFTPRGFSFSGNSEKVQDWKKLLEPYGGSEFSQGHGGTDIGPLNEQLNTIVSSFVPDNQRYFDIHHSRGDVFEAVNKRELLLGAVNMAAIIYLVDKYGL